MNNKLTQALEAFETRDSKKMTFFVDPATVGMIIAAAKFAYETWGKKENRQ